MNLTDNFFDYFQQDQELFAPTTSTTTTPFDDFTLHSPTSPPPPPLVEHHCQNGFKPWKWKNPLSPIPKRKHKREKTKANYHEKSSVRNQLREIVSNLGPDSPFFLKSMIHCNVVHGYSLTLPKQFCYWYLPLDDATITLEDERGQEYGVIYLGDKRRLSGGWRRFCIAHKLVLGDLIVFHLVNPLKFKVYKVEPDSLTEVDAAFILLKLSLSTLFEEYHPMSPPKDVCRDNIRTTSPTIDAIFSSV